MTSQTTTMKNRIEKIDKMMNYLKDECKVNLSKQQAIKLMEIYFEKTKKKYNYPKKKDMNKEAKVNVTQTEYFKDNFL